MLVRLDKRYVHPLDLGVSIWTMEVMRVRDRHKPTLSRVEPYRHVVTKVRSHLEELSLVSPFTRHEEKIIGEK